MKQFSVGFLLFAFVLGMVTTPESALAKRGGDDDSDHSGYSDDDSDEMDDSDSDDDSDEDEDRNGLEVEADIFTDITIVKVELRNGSKTVFTTDANTSDEVVDVVVSKFGLTEAEVLAALDLEIENRASRTKERAKISGVNNHPIEVCASSSSALEVEADVFTNTTIVKVENNGTTTVFEITATTTDAIAEAVVSRNTTLTIAQVKAVLDLEIEDRASRSSDFTVSLGNNDDDCDDDSNENRHSNNSKSSDSDLRNRISELQKMLETLLRLFSARFGN